MAQAPAFFSDPAFRAELAALGLEFVPSEHDWQDYSEIDVVVAFRTSPPSLLRHKPVSKLSNAWLAGVPAIIGPEPAYLQLRESEHDMRVANDARDVIRELARMVRDPAHYAALRARAAQRAPAFDVPALRDRWLAFFRERVAPAYSQWKSSEASPLRRYPWYFEALLAEGIAAKRFRALVRRESAARIAQRPVPGAAFEPPETPSLLTPRQQLSQQAIPEESVRPPVR